MCISRYGSRTDVQSGVRSTQQRWRQLRRNKSLLREGTCQGRVILRTICRIAVVHWQTKVSTLVHLNDHTILVLRVFHTTSRRRLFSPKVLVFQRAFCINGDRVNYSCAVSKIAQARDQCWSWRCSIKQTMSQTRRLHNELPSFIFEVYVVGCTWKTKTCFSEMWNVESSVRMTALFWLCRLFHVRATYRLIPLTYEFI